MLLRPLLHHLTPSRPPSLCHLSATRTTTTASTPPLISPALLKQCKSASQANLFHQQTLVQGQTHRFSTNLISTYLALEAPSPALSLLQRLTPSAATAAAAVFWWNDLIRRAVRVGLKHHTLTLFKKMMGLGCSPDHFTFPFVLKACGEIPLLSFGAAVHGLICRLGYDSNVFVCNAEVAMYGRCGALGYARKVFDEMREKCVFDLVSWNSIIAVYMQSGDGRAALGLFDEMCNGGGVGVGVGFKPDAVSLVNVLPACVSVGASLHGREVHGFAVRSGLFEDIFVANALVDMYANCGMITEASGIFERMKERDVVSWNSMVTGYSQAGRFEDALGLFEKMREENIQLDVVSWSAVIAGYAQRGLGYKTLDVFRQMQSCGSKPNEVTLVSLLSGCAAVGALLHGMETHAYAVKCVLNSEGSDWEDDLMVINALIDMYAKCKATDAARAMFDCIVPTDRNVITWTAMIGGYAQHGEANDALELFTSMFKQDKLVKPNDFTISCALMACARLSALRVGRQIHAYVLRNKHDSATPFVANCLIDMYSKSGDVDTARVVFDLMKQKNDVSWTSLMSGYGMHGRGVEALEVFDKMRKQGLAPDGVTLLVVLYACSHSGLVDQGIKYFDGMNKEFGVVPGAEHYACMVDLLGRAGRLDDAMNLIQGMPMEPCPIIWVALLNGCRIHCNVELGEYALKQLSELESENDGSYTLLSNIYANASRWKDVSRIRSLMKQKGIRKRPGCSWVQGKKGTATFFVGDRTHPETNQIYELLADLIQRIKVLGYVPDTRCALHDVGDEEKGDLLWEHSEKLALAYGILTSAPGAPIRITKNLRVCGDCHTAITYISMIIDHEVILRDSSRFHHFKNGSCSCRGYW